MKKAIVVGSGFGGIASAKTRANGFDVKFMRNLTKSEAGQESQKSGHTFAAGPTVFCTILFDELFELNKKREKYKVCKVRALV